MRRDSARGRATLYVYKGPNQGGQTPLSSWRMSQTCFSGTLGGSWAPGGGGEQSHRLENEATLLEAARGPAGRQRQRAGTSEGNCSQLLAL